MAVAVLVEVIFMTVVFNIKVVTVIGREEVKILPVIPSQFVSSHTP